ncbi:MULTISPECIES: Arm DNA-binding domain-containing protein [Salmonella]|uniref:Arm DNA-binding domain-containing protein n=1 Tax=Salmonella TaxID=590 RepID=UPI0035251ABC
MARSAPRLLEKPYKNHRFTNSVPDGSKLWYFRYRFGGKENRLTFGPYPQVTLAKAREKRNAARKLLVSGICPSLMPVSVKERNGVRAAYVHGGAYGDDAVGVDYLDVSREGDVAPYIYARQHSVYLRLMN